MGSDANRSAPVPSVDEVRRIVAIANPVIRNLEITHCYSRLAAEFTTRIGDGANWCTYATWASRQAGRTIRGEDLLDHLGSRLAKRRWLLHPIATLWRRLLRRGLFQPETRIGRLTAELHTPFDAFERASAAVARGNLKVFEEIGLEFARYLNECLPDTPVDAPRSAGSSTACVPAIHPRGSVTYGRRSCTTSACGSSASQRRAPSSPCSRTSRSASTSRRACSRRSARRSMPPTQRRRIWAACARGAVPVDGALVAGRPGPAAAAIGVVAAGFQRTVEQIAREAIIDSFMVLTLPERVLALGSHLDDAYPEVLDEPADAELIELLARFEPVRSCARRLRRARLVGSPPADALHRASVPRVPSERRSLPPALHAGAGGELQPRGRAGRRALKSAGMGMTCNYDRSGTHAKALPRCSTKSSPAYLPGRRYSSFCSLSLALATGCTAAVSESEAFEPYSQGAGLVAR